GWDAAGEWKAAEPSPDAIQSVLANLPASAPRRRLLRVFQAGTLAASLFISAMVGSSQRTGPPSQTTPRAVATARPASIGLASLRPSVGALYVQDENGRPAGELSIGSLDVRVEIQDGVARTEIEEIFQNRTDRRLEGTFLFPLPPDASISRLAMEIDGKLMEGEVVERQKARETYEGIVRRMNDPALLEWMPGGLFKCRIFPIEARSDKRIIIAYTQALSAFDGRGTYVYPLAGDSAGDVGIGRFHLEATVRAGSRVLRAESTSHDATAIRVDDRTIRTTFSAAAFRPRADFVLAFETALAGELQLSAHRPDPATPGYFAAFITPRPDADEGYRRDRRLFFLIDASGSVTRPELEAARTVVRRMIETLGPADRFRIGSHNDLVESMENFVAPDAAGKAAAHRFLGAIEPIGAGDPATSLEHVLPLVPDDGEVVYVGEGTPTWGEKDPAKIVARLRKVAKDRGVSIRTIAVGSGADRGLLETLAREFNGGAHAISPSDDVRSRADEIARTLGRSAVNDLKVEFQGPVTDAAPAKLGSLHFGERLLVTGRYGAGPVKLILTGKVFDRVIRREFALTLPERESGNAHVKRLWAQRRLADLVAEGEPKKAEAIKLSVEHQVMTPYTSFLVLESEKAYEDFRIERTKKEIESQTVRKQPSKTGHPMDGEVLANRIKATIDSNSWSEAKGKSCVFQNGLIIVRNTPEVHRKVRKFLDELRASLGGSPEKRTDATPPEPAAGETGVCLDMYNVQDLTYGLQDFPGVNITLSEDGLASAGGSFTLEEPSESGTMGKLLSERTTMGFSTFPGQQFSSFPDPGNGEDFGLLALRPYESQNASDYRFLRSNRLPLSRGPGPSDL
ncbi:MAG TPA: VIT and VWA domain-containing protein, partial [Planctomycetota bacterium]